MKLSELLKPIDPHTVFSPSCIVNIGDRSIDMSKGDPDIDESLLRFREEKGRILIELDSISSQIGEEFDVSDK